MKMNQEKLILQNLIQEKWIAQGVEVNQDLLNVLLKFVDLEEGQSNKSEEIRSIKIEEMSDGKMTATYFSWYNLLRIKYRDFFGFALKITGAIVAEDKYLKLALGILAVLHEFHPSLTFTFNEVDAKVLAAICLLGKEEFQLIELNESYQKEFKTPLDEDQAARSLRHFQELKLLRERAPGHYMLRNEMTYEKA
jgi:hypothetical protein